MIAHRPMDDRDRKFVVDSWAKSYRESPYAGLIQMADWFPVMLRQIEKLLKHPRVKVIMAYDPEDKDRVADLYGWICLEPANGPHSPLVYFVFVKSAYRRHRIAAGLFKAAEVVLDRPFRYACKTYVVDELEESHEMTRLAPYATFDRLAGCH